MPSPTPSPSFSIARRALAGWLCATILAGCAGTPASPPDAPLSGASGPSATPASAVTFTGRATDPETGALLYTEAHAVEAGGRRETVRYLDPNGAPLGEKTLDYGTDPYAPLYRLSLASGYREGITDRSPDGRSLTLVRGSRTGTVAVTDALPLVADNGLDRFVQANFTALARGESFNFHVVVVPRFETYRLQVSRLDAPAADAPGLPDAPGGAPPLRLEVGADSLFLRLLAPPATLTYDGNQRYLRRYEGLSTIRNPATGRIYGAVRVDYTPPAPAP